MGLELCKSCGKLHWSTDPCKESPAVAEALRATREVNVGNGGRSNPPKAANQLERVPQEQVEPNDTSIPAARSNTPPNRNAYSARYMREVYRPKLRARKATASQPQR